MQLRNSFIWIISVLLMAGCTQSEANNGTKVAKQDTTQKEWALVVHGGAGAISKDKPDSVKKAYKNDIDKALSICEAVLSEGGSSLDAVESVDNYVEDHRRFSARKGAVYTHHGNLELGAAIIAGNKRKAGTITGVTTVKNPISLSRLVMVESQHVMFAAKGAE